MKNIFMSFLLLIAFTGISFSQVSILTNGSFSGSTGWTTNNSFYYNSTYTSCQTCPGYAYAASSTGQPQTNLNAYLEQAVTIPATATSATLGFYTNATLSAGSTGIEKLFTYLYDYNTSSTYTVSNIYFSSTTSYTYYSYTIPSSLFGHSLMLGFNGRSGTTPTTIRVDEVSFTYIPGGGSLNTPPNFSIIYQTPTSVRAVWDYVSNATSYDILNNCNSSTILNTTNNYYDFTGLTPNQTKQCQVKAKNSSTSSTATNCLGYTLPDYPPTLTVPSNAATNIATVSTVFNWNISANNSPFYFIQISTSASFGTSFYIGAYVTGNSYTLPATQVLASNTTYYWRMASMVSGGNYGNFSSTYSFTTGNSGSNFSVYGNVKDNNGNNLSGVAISYGSGTTFTDANGNYIFTMSNSWSGTVTPSFNNFTFSPVNRSVSIASANVYGQDFVGTSTAATYSISGYVKNASNVAIPGISVIFNSSSYQSTTDVNGFYNIVNIPVNSNGNIIPSTSGFTYLPVSIPIASLNSNLTNQNFTATSNGTNYTISGNISKSTGGSLQGVTITGSGYSSISDASGNYNISVPQNTNIVNITANLTGYTFTPASISIGTVTQNLSGKNFTGTVNTTKTLSLINPSGGEIWNENDTKTILWTSSNISNVKLEYSIDNGNSYSTIVANISSTTGSYIWTLPTLSSDKTQCYVKISEVAGILTDKNSTPFAIKHILDKYVWFGFYCNPNYPSFNSYKDEIGLETKMITATTPNSSKPPIKICADGTKSTKCIISCDDADFDWGKYSISLEGLGINGAELCGSINALDKQFTINGQSKIVSFWYKHPDYCSAHGPYSEVNIVVYENAFPSNRFVYPLNIYRPPLIMIHGFFGGESTFYKMQESFKKSSIPYIPKYPPQLMESVKYTVVSGLGVRASVIKIFYDQKPLFKMNVLNNKYSFGKFDIICHSMGGVVSRAYVEETYNGFVMYKNDVNRIITINSPHSGSQLADHLSNFVNLIPSGGPVGDIIKFSINNLTALNDLKSNPPFYNAISDLNKASNLKKLDRVNIFTISTINGDAPILGDVPFLGTLSLSVLYSLKVSGCPNGQSRNCIFNFQDNDWVVPIESQTGGSLKTWKSQKSQSHIGSSGTQPIIDKALELLSSGNNMYTNALNPPQLPLFKTSTSNEVVFGELTNGINSSVKIISPINNSTINNNPNLLVQLSNTSNKINRGVISLIDGKNVYVYSTMFKNFVSPIAINLMENWIGSYKLEVLGFDDDNNIHRDTINLNLNLNAILDSIQLSYNYDTILISKLGNQYIEVKGFYSNGAIKFVENESQFTSLDSNIFIMDSNIALGKNPGIGIIKVNVGKYEIAKPVKVIYNEDLINIMGIPTIPKKYPENYNVTVLPNPFTYETTISYNLPDNAMVSLTIFNMLGQKIKTIVNEKQLDGNYSYKINLGENEDGLYFYSLQVNDVNQTGKMILINNK